MKLLSYLWPFKDAGEFITVLLSSLSMIIGANIVFGIEAMTEFMTLKNIFGVGLIIAGLKMFIFSDKKD